METDLKVLAAATRQRQRDKDAGSPTTLVRFSSWRGVSQTVADVGILPVAEGASEVRLQNGNGDFYFLDGYSDPNGPDVAGG